MDVVATGVTDAMAPVNFGVKVKVQSTRWLGLKIIKEPVN